jgi:hypothetical protein
MGFRTFLSKFGVWRAKLNSSFISNVLFTQSDDVTKHTRITLSTLISKHYYFGFVFSNLTYAKSSKRIIWIFSPTCLSNFLSIAHICMPSSSSSKNVTVFVGQLPKDWHVSLLLWNSFHEDQLYSKCEQRGWRVAFNETSKTRWKKNLYLDVFNVRLRFFNVTKRNNNPTVRVILKTNPIKLMFFNIQVEKDTITRTI